MIDENNRGFSQLAIARSIAGNIASASAANSTRAAASRVGASSRETRGELSDSRYNPKLSNNYARYEHAASELKSGSNLMHWLNYFLSLRFYDSELSILYERTSLTSQNFYNIAKKNYHLLYVNSRLNFSKISEQGLNYLHKKNIAVSAGQWRRIIEYENSVLMKKITDPNGQYFICYYATLANSNQRRLRQALIDLAPNSPQYLDALLKFFDLSVDDVNVLLHNHSYQDARLGSAETSRDDYIAFLNSLPTSTRLSFILSSHQYNTALWIGDALKCDDFTIDDLLKVLQAHAKGQYGAIPANAIFTTFALMMLANAEDTVAALNKPLIAHAAESSQLLNLIIQHAALKSDYERNRQSSTPQAYNITDDVEFGSGNSDNDNALLRPLDYNELIQAGQTLVDRGNHLYGFNMFVQAMNQPNRDIDPAVLQVATELYFANPSLSRFNLTMAVLNERYTSSLMLNNYGADILREVIDCEQSRQRLLSVGDSYHEFKLKPRLLERLISDTRDLQRQFAANPQFFQQQRDAYVNLWREVLTLIADSTQHKTSVYVHALKYFALLNSEQDDNQVLNEIQQDLHAQNQHTNDLLALKLYTEMTLNLINPNMEKCFQTKRNYYSWLFVPMSSAYNHENEMIRFVSNTATDAGKMQFNKQLEPLEPMSDEQIEFARAELSRILLAKTNPWANKQSVRFIGTASAVTASVALLAGAVLAIAGMITVSPIALLAMVTVGSIGALTTRNYIKSVNQKAEENKIHLNNKLNPAARQTAWSSPLQTYTGRGSDITFALHNHANSTKAPPGSTVGQPNSNPANQTVNEYIDNGAGVGAGVGASGEKPASAPPPFYYQP